MKALFWVDGAAGAGKSNFLFWGYGFISFITALSGEKVIKSVRSSVRLYFTAFCLRIKPAQVYSRV